MKSAAQKQVDRYLDKFASGKIGTLGPMPIQRVTPWDRRTMFERFGAGLSLWRRAHTKR